MEVGLLCTSSSVDATRKDNETTVRVRRVFEFNIEKNNYVCRRRNLILLAAVPLLRRGLEYNGFSRLK
jgi:hypothetical protein